MHLHAKHTVAHKQNVVGGRPYPEVTAAFLPSSLGSFHPFALVFSTIPPVLVYGTDTTVLKLRGFSWKALHAGRLAVAKLPVLRRALRKPDFPNLQRSLKTTAIR